MEIEDEMYFVRVDSSRTTVLLESSSPDHGSSCAAWAHELGRGRVFCFTPGHRPEVLAATGYRQILSQGLRWALRSG
jgi:type 1 glutamine amidotransferase